MTDANTEENEFGKELASAFEADEAPVKPEDSSKTPAPETPKTEDKKPDEPAKPEDSKKEEPEATPAADEKSPEEGGEKPKDPETPAAPEEPKPLTKDDIKEVVQNIRTEERDSGKALDNQLKEVMDAYYPDGLSNVLVDEKTGKELRTPADVVAVAPDMSMEDAAQWLMNEQFKLDQQVNKIKDDARTIAETNLKFKQDTADILTRYEPLFKAYPAVQTKVWDQYKKLMNVDEAKGVILSAPDMREFYDTMLEPYRLAFEHGKGQPATNPVAPDSKVETPAAPGADDRLDEGGDGGASPVDDPNDFAQQVTKELEKGA